MTAIPLQRAKSALKGDSVRKHAALTGINGSLAAINVESPACGARSKTTIVRRAQILNFIKVQTTSDSSVPAASKTTAMRREREIYDLFPFSLRGPPVKPTAVTLHFFLHFWLHQEDFT